VNRGINLLTQAISTLALVIYLPDKGRPGPVNPGGRGFLPGRQDLAGPGSSVVTGLSQRPRLPEPDTAQVS
jgi:hypothetical protein